jgi:hypothetical protein
MIANRCCRADRQAISYVFTRSHVFGIPGQQHALRDKLLLPAPEYRSQHGKQEATIHQAERDAHHGGHHAPRDESTRHAANRLHFVPEW